MSHKQSLLTMVPVLSWIWHPQRYMQTNDSYSESRTI